MTGPEFVKAHGAPLGDDDHDQPWTVGDWDVFEHLTALANDERRDRSTEPECLLLAAEYRRAHPAPDTTTGGSR